MVAVDNNENVYVVDHGSSLVDIFNERGDFIKSIKTRFKPYSIAIDSRSNVYLGCGNSRHEGVYVFKYDKNGKLLTKFCRPNDARTAAVVELSGWSGALCLMRNENLVFSLHYPYDSRIYSKDGKLLQRFARENKLYNTPKWNKQYNLMESRGGCASVKVMPDGKIVNLIFTRNKHDEGKNDYMFDIFSPDGDWLISIPASSFKVNFTKTFAFDNEGYIYIVYHEPFPHLKKFFFRFN
jgi:hypothetical protein